MTDNLRAINARNQRTADVFAAARALLASGQPVTRGADLIALAAGQPDASVTAEVERLTELYL